MSQAGNIGGTSNGLEAISGSGSVSSENTEVESFADNESEGSESQAENAASKQANSEAGKSGAAEQKKKLNKLRLKVHGEEIEEELPFEIEENSEAVEYLTKQLQLSRAASRAMQENTTFKQQVKQFLGDLKSNTKEALLQAGIDPKEFAAAVIEEEIRKAQLSPEEREKQELQERLRQLEEENKMKEEAYNKKELARLRQMEFERIDNQITSALDENKTVPKTPYTVRRIAEYMLEGVRRGLDFTPADVLPLVEDDLKKDFKDIINAMGEDAAEEFIGKEIFDRMRKKKLAKAKQPVTPATIKKQLVDVGVNKSDKPKQDEKVDYKKFFGF